LPTARPVRRVQLHRAQRGHGREPCQPAVSSRAHPHRRPCPPP